VFPWVLTALVAGAWLFWPLAEAPRAVVRTSVVLPAEGRRSIAISPDGTTIVYGTRAEDKLYVRHLDQEESTPIPGTEGADTPFFSPDGEWVGFFTFADGLKKVRLDGVGAVALSEGAARGGSWMPDDTIVFAGTRMSGLTRISAGGGTPETLTALDPDKQEQSHRWPQLLPNGDAVLFTAYSGGRWEDTAIVAQSLSTGERRVVAHGAQARYVSTGHLVYAAGGTLYAVPFDADRLEVSGRGVPVLVGVGSWGSGEYYFAISETGTLIYVPSAPTDRRVVLVDLEGRVEPLAAPAGPYSRARFSPDGRQLALMTDDSKVHLYELEHERFSLLFSSITDQAGSVWTPSSMEWSPDGTRLAVSADTPGSGLNSGILIVPVDGRGPVEQVAMGLPAAWSPDGKRLLYVVQEHDREFFHVWEVPLEPKGEPRLLVKTEDSLQMGPVFSPDGRWLAYESSESGRSEVHVKPYDGAGGSRQISIDGGENPVWAPDGREVYYPNGEKMMAVTISTEPTFSAGRPRELFEGAYAYGLVFRWYDLSPDGRKFVMIENAEESPVTQIHVVHNWTEELKRLVPTR